MGAAILTDEDRSFGGLGEDLIHLAVDRSAGEYVRLLGYVHTNSIKSALALLKHHIYGIHHWVSSKHLKRYVAEMTFRWNRREATVTERMSGLFACVDGPMPYKVLIA